MNTTLPRTNAHLSTPSNLRIWLLATTAVACLMANTTHAGWSRTALGNYDYLTTGNWAGDVIDDSFPTSLTLTGAQTLTFEADRTTPGPLSFQYVGNFPIALIGTNGNHTLTLGGNVTVAPASNQTITVGNATGGKNLNLDLGGATRTLTVNPSKTLVLQNVVSNGGLLLNGGGTVTLNGVNTFAGGLTIDNGINVNFAFDSALGTSTGVVQLTTNGRLTLGSTPFAITRRIDVGSGGGVLHTPNTVSHIPGVVNATGRVTLSGNNVANLTLSGANRFADGISFGTLTMLSAASEANLGGPTTPFYDNVKLSPIGNFMTSFGLHSVTNVVACHIETQSPTCVFTITNAFKGNINASTAAVFHKYGPGTVVIAGPQTYNNTQLRYGTAVLGGTLIVDANQGGSLHSGQGGSIAVGSGTLMLRGKAAGVTTQSVMNVYASALESNMDYRKTGGATVVVDDNGGSGTVFNMGLLVVTNENLCGTTVHLKTVGPNALFRTTATNDATGILGLGRAVFNSADWASVGANSNVVAYAGYTGGLPASGASASTNYRQTGNASVTASESAYSLKLDTSASGQSLTIAAGQTLTLTTGGLLFTGADNYGITGGALNSATITNSDLIVHQYGSGALTLGSVIANGTGASRLTKSGPGTLVLTAATNTYTGFTYIHDGVVSISANSQLGLPSTGAKVFLQGGTLRATETFSLDNAGANKRAVGLGGSGGTFDVANGKTLTIGASVTGIPLGGTTNGRGVGRLVLANSDGGDGMLIINSGCYFTGGIVIEAGILQMMHSDALNPTGINTVTFGSGTTAKLLVRNTSPMIAGLYASNPNAAIESGYGSGTATLSVANGGDCTYAGVLRNGGAGLLALTKLGCGKLTLSGTNTYTGATTVQDGTLAVNGSLVAASAVTVSGGALGGTGTVNGTVNITTGTLAPGASAGALTTGALTLGPASALDFELGSTGNADRVDVVGNLTLDGTLNVTALAGFEAGYYTLLTYTGTLTNNGLELGTLPNLGLTYSIKTSTAGSVILSATRPCTILMVR